ncbi:hypothetical protein ABH912_005906 [Pseudomonas sp. BT76 TE3572]|uniref:Uncharacterized protein n=1 Tax=Pseudomonas mandelii PD30 TaxID=1419583 RepID=A0A059L653_9PSED|nr:hypothetical protein V466_07785 [Pseudomonas mandelii PD30]
MAPSILKTMMLDQFSEMARDAEKHSGNRYEDFFTNPTLTLCNLAAIKIRMVCFLSNSKKH